MSTLPKPVPLLALIAALALFPAPARPAELPVVDHVLDVHLDPAAGELRVTDRLTLPPGRDTVDLLLHRDLAPRVLAGEATLERRGRDRHLETLRLRLSPAAAGTVTLGYGGAIRHGLTTVGEGMGRERQETAGIIGPEGVFLDGGSGWYPRLPGARQRLALRVTLPPGWQAVSQGAGPEQAGFAGSAWTETQPQDDLYLVAAPFTRYHEAAGAGIEAQVWLRAPDADLAARYLAATRDYLELYSRLIGPYPYAKFALVENFWETGYGMPSFTLLGPRVLRLPFILATSYPHEVLHNWWGNGVYVAEDGGNWSEGLTAYLADHLLREREGRGAAYRRDLLQAYADYVQTDRDFPLEQFRGRHGEVSQAIGYGKAALVFHNLRLQLGDAAFIAGLRRFYAEHRFRAAGYADLRRAFEAASGRDLTAYFAAWTSRTGAARLALREVRTEAIPTGHRVSGLLAQTQDAAPFPLAVPVVVHPVAGPPQQHLVAFAGREQRFAVELPAAPVRLAVDPEFDCFRALEPGESPVALSRLFGAERGLILLPAAAEPALLAAYRDLATAWQAGHPGLDGGAGPGLPAPAGRPGGVAAGLGESLARRLRRRRPGLQPGPGAADPEPCRRGRGPGSGGGGWAQPGARPRAGRRGPGLAGRHRSRRPARTGPQAAPLRRIRLCGLRRRGPGQPSQGAMAARRLPPDPLVRRRAADPAAGAARQPRRGCGQSSGFGLPAIGEWKYPHRVFVRILAARSAPPVARVGWLQRRAGVDSVPARDKIAIWFKIQYLAA